ncbi:MAG: dihydrolipoyl dehydrogenase [Desulfovibrio sp.]|jgi:dihydrolipoamide dehydrogenase|nr:dihydrolipoyl dehydrogenase [Desulfovibrio sp.]
MRITIVGAGPGGYAAAFRAARGGAQVTLVEAGRLGGTCLNRGCIPTKTLKASAEALETIRRAEEFGVTLEGAGAIDMVKVLARKRKVVDTLRDGLAKTCAKAKVVYMAGRGTVVGKDLVRCETPEGKVVDIPSDRVIVATGSSPAVPPSIPLDHARIMTSDDVLELDRVPESMCIAGGGVVGAELAFIFRTFGSRVTVVEGLDRLLPLPSVDAEMSKLLQREMKKAGIGVELCRIIASAEVAGNCVKARLAPSPFVPAESLPNSAKAETTIDAEVLVVATGRSPNTRNMGLEDAGVALDARGYVLADSTLATNVPGIYAIGDALGPSRIMLAHMASFEGMAAADNCLGAERPVSYDVVPGGIFTSPEIADVGLTEAQAREKGHDVACPLFLFRELGKAQAMGSLPGVFKLVVDNATGRLLGAHFAGAHATDIIAEAALALQMGATVKDIAGTIHAHPTLAEGVFEAAMQL